jgi:3-carboxy-cis,cis-muconate cycloisomerase
MTAHVIDSLFFRDLHWGATTQDVMDTAIVLQLREALKLSNASLNDSIAVTSSLAQEYQHTVMVGRTTWSTGATNTFGFKETV